MKKLYYSIGEVSELTGLEPHVLRYWETIFKELKPRKNSAGNRTYKDDDIATILKIKELIHDKKYSTEGAREVLEADKNGQNTGTQIPSEVQRDLREIKLFLNKLLEKL